MLLGFELERIDSQRWLPHEELRASVAPRHLLPVLLHGAVLVYKLGRLWRRPCCKSTKPQRAHGLAMHHAMLRSREELRTNAAPRHLLPVLFHGAVLVCKLGRLWRRPCCKSAQPQRAHGLAMHHAMLRSHEELRTSATPRHLLPVLFA